MKTRSDNINNDIIKGIIKAIVIIPTVLIFAFVISQLIRVIRYETAKTRAAGNGLYIVTDGGTNSMGSSWSFQIFGENIEYDKTNELTKGFFTGTGVKESYLFKPVSEGTAYILVNSFDGGGINPYSTKLYSVTADKDLNISYTVCDVKQAPVYYSEDYFLTLGNNKIALDKSDKLDLRSYLIGDYIDANIPANSFLEGLPKLEGDKVIFYFDTDSGLLYSVNKQEKTNERIFQIDEHILPYFKEYLNGYSEQR